MLTDYVLGPLDPGTGETLTNTRLMAAQQIDTLTTPVARDIGAGKSQFLNFVCMAAVAGATVGSTVDLQALALVMPIPAAATYTLTSFANAGDLVTTPAHGYATGTPVRFTGAGLPPEIVAGTTYYVIKVSSTTFTVATTLANALAGTTLAVSADGTGTMTVTSVPTGVTTDIQPAQVSVANDTLTITDHGMQTGQPFQIYWTGSLAIAGVTTGAMVFAIRVDANTIKVATTHALALAGTGADITVTTNAVTTVVVQPIPLGSSGPILKELLTVGSIIPVSLNPQGNYGVNASATLAQRGGRYLTAAINPSATMTAGKFKIELVPTVQSNQKYHSVGTPVT